MTARNPRGRQPPRHEGVDPPALRFRQRYGGSGLFRRPMKHVPDIDPDYRFDKPTNRSPYSRASRTIVGSSSPATTAPANRRTSSRWRPASTGPACGVNLDSHISRIDLIGKDAIVIRDGMQVTEFRDGILPVGLPAQRRAVCFDEYDAGPSRCDVRDFSGCSNPPVG